MKAIVILLSAVLVIAFTGLVFAQDEVKAPENRDQFEKVVGDDIEIGEGEFKIISIMDPEPVVGDDIKIEDDMAKIISIDDENEKDNKPLVAGISAGVIVLAGAVYLLTKKKQQ